MKIKNQTTLARQIYFMAQDIRNLAERFLSPHGLTLEQFQTLKQLSPDQGITQRHLGEALGKTPANVTRILDRLEIKSLTRRKPNPTDRRACLIFLTPEGKRLTDGVKEDMGLFSKSLHQGLTDEMQTITCAALSIMKDNIDTMSSALKEEQK